MEPEDQSLHHLLDSNQPAGPEDLRAIVTKANRHRVRFAAVTAAAALAVGGGVGGAIGYASSNHSNHSVQTASSPPAGNYSTGAPASAAAGGSASSISGTTVGSTALTHEFTRTANGVDIRGYEITSRTLAPATNNCFTITGPRFEAEVSTDKAVGTVMGGYGSGTTALQSMSGAIIGASEGGPVAVVVASTSNAVASVKVTFTGGATDEMAPTAGWVALAGPIPASAVKGKTVTTLPQIGTVTGYSAAGAKVFSQALTPGAASWATTAPQLAPNFSTVCGRCAGPPTQYHVSAPNPSGAPSIENPTSRVGAYACPLLPGSAGSGSAKTGSIGGGTASSGAATVNG